MSVYDGAVWLQLSPEEKKKKKKRLPPPPFAENPLNTEQRKKCFHLRNLKIPYRENSLIKDRLGESSTETQIYRYICFIELSK